MKTTPEIKQRLEYLRGCLRRESISWGELHELQTLAEHIAPGDVELLEAAGVPEFPELTTQQEKEYREETIGDDKYDLDKSKE